MRGIIRFAQNDKQKGNADYIVNLLHGFEHGLGGGEEFGVGDVVDDFVGPMPEARTKARRPLRFFLSAGVSATSLAAEACGVAAS